LALAFSNALQIYDTALNKRFLSKSPLPRDVSPKDFFVGSKVLIHARLFTVVDYADPYTRRTLGPASEGTTLLIGPDAYFDTGKILEGLTGGTGLKVTKLQSFALNEPELQGLLPLLGDRGDRVPYEQQLKFWCRGACVAVELSGPDATGAVATLATQLRRRFAANELEAAVWHADGLGAQLRLR
jgi:nucleoside-diphosphate kinase